MENKNTKPFYQALREEYVRDCLSSRTRNIALDSFTVTQVFEEEYVEYLKLHPALLKIYKKWILSQKPAPGYSLDDEDFYNLREEIIKRPGEEVLTFLLDILIPGLESKILKNLEYWRVYLSNDEETLKRLTLKVLLETLKINSKEYVKEEGYPDFVVSFLDKFQYVSFSFLNLKHLELYTIKSDDKFKKSFEEEWKRLCLYQDGFYGFEVLPLLQWDDYFRYLKLPFNNKTFSQLKNTKEYQQVNNYIVAMAFFKPLPHPKLGPAFREQLFLMYEPLLRSGINQYEKRSGTYFSEDKKAEMTEWIKQEIAPKLKSFDFFYASAKKLEKNFHEPKLFSLIGRGGLLTRLGLVTDSDEYPFTAFYERALKDLMRKKLGGSEYEGDSSIFSEEALKDLNPKRLGTSKYKRDTFITMTGVSRTTLKRWDLNKILSPRRVGLYRCYTEDDFNSAQALIKKRSKYRRK